MPGIQNVSAEPALIERLQNGEEAAQSQIYRLYSKPVYTMAYRIVANKETAEDVTQEVFIDILTKAKTLRDAKSFNGWVQRITANRCKMALRSAWFRRRSDISLDDLSLESEISTHETTITTAKAFNSLPAKTRLVLWLFCVEGFTHSEIGDWLGKSASYSKSIVNRASRVFEDQYKTDQEPSEGLPALQGN